jgi:adenylate cyclase
MLHLRREARHEVFTRRDAARGERMAGDFALGERTTRTITVLCTDLRGFSDLHAGLTPIALADLMDAYYQDAIAVVGDEGGAVDKFSGDSMFAFFNAFGDAADPPARAVLAALTLKKKVAARWPALALSAGIATGDAVVGRFGSRTHSFLTALGDVVTLAARLERRSHLTGFQVLVDEPTRAGLDARFAVSEHPAGGLTVAGKVFAVAPGPQDLWRPAGPLARN